MDIHEYMENHRYGTDLTKGERVKLEYFDYERNFINHIIDNKFSITKKARQMHMTTLLAHYVTWFLLFNEDYENNNILYVAPKRDNCLRFINLVNDNLNDYHSSIKPKVNTSREIEMVNGNRLKVSGPITDAFRGYKVYKLIIDEAAFIDLSKILSVSFTNLSTNGTIDIISTTNGLNDFYKVWEGSVTESNNFKPLSIIWSDNPTYTKEWFNEMCKSLNHNQDNIDQELLAKFVPSKTKRNKNVKLQVRVSEGMLEKIFLTMNKKGFTDYSKYIRDLIIKDVNI